MVADVRAEVGPRLAIEPEDENELGIVSLANLLPVEQAGVVTRKGRTLSTSALNFLSVMKDTLSVANGRRPSGSWDMTSAARAEDSTSNLVAASRSSR